MGPAQLYRQCRDYLLLRKHLGKADHMPDIFGRKPVDVFHFQLSRQRRDNFRPIIGSLSFEFFLIYPLADSPVKHGKPDIHRGGDGRSNIAQQPGKEYRKIRRIHLFFLSLRHLRKHIRNTLLDIKHVVISSNIRYSKCTIVH